MNQESNLVTVEDLSIFIKNHPIVEDVSFKIQEGEKVALAGPSGSGKTLTAYSIAGLLDRKFSLKARIMFLKDAIGNKINLLNLSAAHYHQIGFIFQEPQVALNPLLPIGKQLREGLNNFIPSAELDKSIQTLLVDLDLPEDPTFLEAFPHELSGGQQQRVVIGMAIAKNPRLLIADEPTTSLDPKNTIEILELIMKMVDQKKMSLLLITHDQKIIDKYCDRVLPFHLVNNLNTIASKSSINVEVVSSSKFELITLSNVNLYLRRRNNDYQPVIQNLSTSIHKGEIIGLVGKSGSGKSSLCKILSGLINIQNGAIKIHCQLHKIQLVQQDPFQSLNPKFTVEETIGEVLKQHHKVLSINAIQLKISNILIEVGLSDQYRNRRPFELSGGERQRVAIARSLAVEPEILICDEAVSALDYPTQKMIINLLIELNRNRQMAILFVTHDLSLVKFCQTIWVLDQGKMAEQINNKDGNLTLKSKAGLSLKEYHSFFKK